MSTSTPSVLEPASEDLFDPNEHLDTQPAGMTPALRRCCDAWADTLRDCRTKGVDPVICYMRANAAYRAAMPPLTTAKNIQNFIHCVAFGTMNGPIALVLMPKLLYAAQVATVNLRNSGPKSAPSKEEKKTKKPHEQRLQRAKRR